MVFGQFLAILEIGVQWKRIGHAAALSTYSLCRRNLRSQFVKVPVT